MMKFMDVVEVLNVSNIKNIGFESSGFGSIIDTPNCEYDVHEKWMRLYWDRGEMTISTNPEKITYYADEEDEGFEGFELVYENGIVVTLQLN